MMKGEEGMEGEEWRREGGTEGRREVRREVRKEGGREPERSRVTS